VKRTISLLLSLATLSTASFAFAAPEGRFDAQTFRPSAAPRDLVMVQKSEVIGHLSPTIGLYTDISLDPLAIAAITTGQEIRAVGARLQVTALAGIGFFDWFDVTMAMPLVAWQISDNLRPLGSEGEISPNALGDLRFNTKIALPYFNRKALIKEGFGLALTGNLNLPTGNQNAFASDGAVTGGVGFVADYRFNIGLLVAANTGIWLRPEQQFAGTKVGDMANFGLSGEMYVVQRWGWSVLGGVFGHVGLDKFPDSPSQVPAEAMLALRFQLNSGFTWTVGGTFGANCGFGAPVFRAFMGLTWQPTKSREMQEIERLKQIDSEDPDHDGLIGQADRCPDMPGVPQNLGCPDTDTDKDGIVDREDKCPKSFGTRGGGCPGVYPLDDQIVTLDEVKFATDRDIILDESKPVLDQVVAVLLEHREFMAIEIEGHTDIRASDAYNINLSGRRVESVRQYMISKGVDPNRLTATGYGHTQPIADDRGCTGPDETLSPQCKEATSKNRRVVFKISKTGTGPARAIGGGDPILPRKDKVLKAPTLLQNGGVLGGADVLGKDERQLPKGSSGTIPQGGQTLQNKGVLQRSGTTGVKPAGDAPKNEGQDKPEKPKPTPPKPLSPPKPLDVAKPK